MAEVDDEAFVKSRGFCTYLALKALEDVEVGLGLTLVLTDFLLDVFLLFADVLLVALSKLKKVRDHETNKDYPHLGFVNKFPFTFEEN